MWAINAFTAGVTRLNDAVGRAVALIIFRNVHLPSAGGGLPLSIERPNCMDERAHSDAVRGLCRHVRRLRPCPRWACQCRSHSFEPRPRKRAGLDIVTSVVFFIFTLTLLWFGIEMAWNSISDWETSYSAWNPPIWPVKLAIPVGTALLVLQGWPSFCRTSRWPSTSTGTARTQPTTKEISREH